jgi:V/A-type H+/Na+-transporting ATPase subunit E
MGIERVKEEVLGKASQAAEKLIAEGQAESKQIKSSKLKEIDAIKAQAKKNLEQQKADIMSRAVSSAELDAKKEMLNARKDLVNSVFDKVKKKILQLPQVKRKLHIAHLLEQAKKEIEVAKVYCAEQDIKLIADYPAFKADILGGIIAENKEGTVRVDLSYDSLLEQVYKDSMKEVSDKLFKK